VLGSTYALNPLKRRGRGESCIKCLLRIKGIQPLKIQQFIARCLAHSVNLAIQEAEIQRIVVRSQPVPKVLDAPSQPMAGCSGRPVIPATKGSTNRRIIVQVSPGIK
jgi:hypothetical protein